MAYIKVDYYHAHHRVIGGYLPGSVRIEMTPEEFIELQPLLSQAMNCTEALKAINDGMIFPEIHR